MKYTIDAKEKRLGRVASQAAIILMGKNRTDFARNANPDDTSVEIINASKINLHPKKLSQKTYAKYSGYPGGLKLLTLENVLQKKGYSEAFKLAVYGMLPSNKLRRNMMKRLTIKE